MAFSWKKAKLREIRNLKTKVRIMKQNGQNHDVTRIEQRLARLQKVG